MIIATAGLVDHGKTLLVKALTATEQKCRGPFRRRQAACRIGCHSSRPHACSPGTGIPDFHCLEAGNFFR
jgi:translation initiation factor 2 gamma subunit (eIF-2gamma)